jgi:prevent-host-death family protein
MASVPITELKAHLAKYLRMAQRGVEVQVLERGVPIARLVAMPAADESETAGLLRLVQNGVIRRGAGGARALLRRRIQVAASLLTALAEDREDRI